METRAALFARGLAAFGPLAGTLRGQRLRPARERAVRRHRVRFLPATAPARLRECHPALCRAQVVPGPQPGPAGLALLWQMPLLALFRFLPAWLYPLFWRRRRSHVVCCFGNNPSRPKSSQTAHAWHPTILCLASDNDLAPDYRPGDPGMNDYRTPHWMAHYALENADHVFVQTESQLRSWKPLRPPWRDHPQPGASRAGTTRNAGRERRTRHHPLDRPIRHLPQAPAAVPRSGPALPRPDLPDDRQQDRCRCLRHPAGAAPDNLTIIERVPHARSGTTTGAPASSSARPPMRASPIPSCNAPSPACRSLRSRLTPRASSPAKGVACSLAASIHWSVTSARCGPNVKLAEHQALTFHRYALEHHGLDSQVEHFESLLRQVIDAPLRSPPPWWRAPRRRFLRTGTI